MKVNSYYMRESFNGSENFSAKQLSKLTRLLKYPMTTKKIYRSQNKLLNRRRFFSKMFLSYVVPVSNETKTYQTFFYQKSKKVQELQLVNCGL